MTQSLGLALVFAASLSPSQTIVRTPAQNPDRIYQLSELKTATLTVGTKEIEVWLMDTASKRQEGMMFLRDAEVKPNQGMLFVFTEPQPMSFWMKNTLIPLDIAYIEKSGRVLNTLAMKPLDLNGHPSKGAALYALEMKQGAFRRLGIKTGVKIGIPKGIRASN